MFSSCGTIASIVLKRGLATSKSIVISRHSNYYCFRSLMNKFQRNYCAATITPKQAPKAKIDKKHTDKISEILESPDKKESDHKHYRVLKLENGLTALLISDPILRPNETFIDAVKSSVKASDRETDVEKLGACSVCIDVGSFSDPRDIQGLAHFLEHMVFMGTRKYPNENEFDQYIKRCAGFNNAETEFERTSYYIEVSEKCLAGALDRFSQLFKDPLMHKETMRREREAVDSEFRSKMQGDDVRKEQLLASMGNPSHPCSTFSWGNLKTLRDNITDDMLYTRVHEFRKRHYSAHRMFVCMQAQYPLDTLQDMLLKHFSDIPSNKLPGYDFSSFTHLNAFQDCFANKVYVVKPVSNMTKLDITFCMESFAREYKTKPHHFVAYLLGYEGKGSLTSYLRKKNWALELVCGVNTSGFGSNNFYSMFTITAYLTSTGMSHIKEVLEAISGYLKYLEIVDPESHGQVLYTELQSIEACNYHFQRERSPLENVENLVVNLKDYPPKNLLNGPSLFFEYDYSAIQLFLEKMNRSPKNIMITNKSRFEGREFDQVEPWFGTQYCSFDVPTDWSEAWTGPKTMHEFKLPEPNVYIPKDLTILYNPDTMSVPAHPEKIMENDICELWYRQDNRFFLPVAYYNFYFISPMAMGNIENVILLATYTMLLKYKIIETLYPATVAGLGYSTYPSEKGIFFKVSGYSQNLHNLVEAYIQKLTTFADEVTEDEFNMFVEQQLKNYYNTMVSPKAFAKTLRLCVIDKGFYPTSEKYETLKKLTLKDFKKYASKFLLNMKIQALFQGNLTLDSAKNVMEGVLKNLTPQPIDNESMMNLQAYKLPVGANYLRCASLNTNDVNTVVCNFYQIGPISMKTINLIEMLLMIAEEPLFHTLRSKEQLCYDVSCGLRDNYGILGYSITVNSQENKFSAEYIEERIEAFRSELLNIIRRTKESEFRQYKESLAKIKLNDDNSLKDEVCRHWAEIVTNEYAFDRSVKDVECLNTITKSEFSDFFEKHFHHTKKLSIQVIGDKEVSSNLRSKSSEPEPNTYDKQFKLKIIPMSKPFKGHCIESIPDFVKTLKLYPVTHTNFKCEE